MIKIAHESPKSVFTQVQNITDYDYALVHLFEEDLEYFKLFQDSLSNNREVILDNSIFELGKSFDSERYSYWINELKPTWYIVPDSLESTKKTCSQMDYWNKHYKNLPGKKIGVVQGKTYNQIKSCYEYMDKIAEVDMIAISFDYSYYEKTIKHSNKYVSWMLGRVKLLNDLLNDGVININKLHHLLGNSLPIEGKFYDYSWLYSMDTSNPVVHAIKNIKYQENFGIYKKESQKLVELINEPIESIDISLLKYNIEEFNKYWKFDKF